MSQSNVRAKILLEYELRRQKKEVECIERINEIHSKFPRLEEIELEIKKAGSQNILDIIKNPSKSDELNKKLTQKLQALEKEKEEYMRSNNIPPDYKEPDYECKICCDKAILKSGERCHCFNQRIINELYNISNMGEILERQNFDTFSFDYYSKEKGNKNKSPYDNMVSAVKTAKEFCQTDKKKRRNLLFYGEVGQGKTFLSSAIAKELLQKGEEVIYMRATKLFNTYEDYKFNRIQDKDFLKKIYSCDLLIIDDLGTENPTKMNVSFLLDLLDERLNRGNSIIINTNLKVSELSSTYSKRFTSRIVENFVAYEFYGEDIRIQKVKR